MSKRRSKIARQQSRQRHEDRDGDSLGASAIRRKRPAKASGAEPQSERYQRLFCLILNKLHAAKVANPRDVTRRILADSIDNRKVLGPLVEEAIRSKDRQRQPNRQAANRNAQVRNWRIDRATDQLRTRAGMDAKEAKATAERLVAESFSMPSLRDKIQRIIDSTTKRDATAEATTGTAKQPQTADWTATTVRPRN